MKIKENVTIYSCDHCAKKYFMKHACVAHEPKCNSNPLNIRKCFDCYFCEKKNTDIHFDVYGGFAAQKIGILYCDKVKSYLYPPRIEHKGNQFIQEDIDEGELPNSPMPMECEHYEQNLPF